MSNLKKYSLSVEVLKYSYCGKIIESEEFLSEKVCCHISKIVKKFTKAVKKNLKKAKPIITSAILVFRLSNDLIPSHAVGLTPFRITPLMIHRSINLEADLSEKLTISSDVHPKFDKIVFTKIQIEKLDEIIMKSNNNFIDEKQLIEALRASGFDEVLEEILDHARAILAATLLQIIHAAIVQGFVVQPNPGMRPWLYTR